DICYNVFHQKHENAGRKNNGKRKFLLDNLRDHLANIITREQAFQTLRNLLELGFPDGLQSLDLALLDPFLDLPASLSELRRVVKYDKSMYFKRLHHDISPASDFSAFAVAFIARNR